jgi:hypothetical protein
MFSEPSGGGAKPYKAKKRRLPKLGGTKQMAKYTAPKQRKVQNKLFSRTSLSPKVGNLKSKSLVPLPTSERKALMNPTQKSPYHQEKRSGGYVAAKRRTKAKFSRRAR